MFSSAQLPLQLFRIHIFYFIRDLHVGRGNAATENWVMTVNKQEINNFSVLTGSRCMQHVIRWEIHGSVIKNRLRHSEEGWKTHMHTKLEFTCK